MRQEAQRRVYSLSPQPLAEINDWLGRYLTLWEQRLDALHTEIARGKRDRRSPMTRKAPGSVRTLGILRAADGQGVVRLEDRFDTDIDDLWTALTDPRRLARWLGEVEGDLREGGEFQAR